MFINADSFNDRRDCIVVHTSLLAMTPFPAIKSANARLARRSRTGSNLLKK